MYKQQKVTNQMSSVSAHLEFVHVVPVERQVFRLTNARALNAWLGHMIRRHMFPVRSRRFGAGWAEHEQILTGNESVAHRILLSTVRGTRRGRVHGSARLRVPGQIRGGPRRSRRRQGRGAAGLDGTRDVKDVLKLTVVHHVIHGRLHLQEHPLLLSLRDASKSHSWKKDRLFIELCLFACSTY